MGLPAAACQVQPVLPSEHKDIMKYLATILADTGCAGATV